MGVRFNIKMTRGVQRAVDRETPETLQEAARYTWRIARNLIKHRANPDKASKPGTAPHSHRNKTNSGFKRTIAYAPADKKTALIGPQLVRGGLTNIARVHEFGGTQVVKETAPGLEDGVDIGDEAPVSNRYLTRKDSVIRKDPHNDPKTGRPVFWIKIRTKKQKEHSKRLYSRMRRKYGKKVRANYPARPYMRPTLQLAKPKLSRFWYNSVRN